MYSVGIIFTLFIRNFEEACDISNCGSYQINKHIKILNNAITLKLHCNYTVIIQ